MRAVQRWRELARIDKGALSRRVETYFEGGVRSVGEKPLHPGTILGNAKSLENALSCWI